MKLSFEIIKAELAGRLNCEVLGLKGETILVEAPKLYEDKTKAAPDCCYVTKTIPAKLIRQRQPLKSLYIICDTIPEPVKKNMGGNILYFSSPQILRHVMNVLLDVFTKYRRWTSALSAALLESKSLNALLRLSIPIFENPLFLMDSRFFNVAAASPGDPPDFEPPIVKVDEAWIIRGKDELLGAMENKEPFFRHLPNDYPRLFINMTEGDYLLGNLSIQASARPFREYDGYLLKQLAAVVHTAMLRSVSSTDDWRNRFESMLSKIIKGGIVSEEELHQALPHLGYWPEDEYRCLAIRIPTLSGKEFIRNFLQILGPQNPAMYIRSAGEIAALLVNESFATRQGIEALSFIEQKVRALGFHVGSSDAYSDLSLSQQYFAQSRYALQCGEASPMSKHITLFSDFCLDYILENVSGELKPHLLWSEGFKRLVLHDVNGRVSYVETLRTYLDNNLNAHRTAAQLCISRNSLLSQLERIQSLLEEDLKDPKVRFRYDLSLLLYDKWAVDKNA